MSRAPLLLSLFCSVLCLALFSCQPQGKAPAAAAASQPNVLLIMVDDMGYSDLGCFGGEIPTPHIDSLASSSVVMTKFYNAARCCPSRASLMTGLYPHLAGMGHQNQDRGLPAYRGRVNHDAATLAQVLASGGYATYHVGKWHLGSERDYWPDRKGFAHHFSLIEGAMNYYNQRPWLKSQDSLYLSYEGREYHTQPGFYATATFTDSAVAFLKGRDREKPFFMYLAYNAPHWPLHAPPELAEKYMDTYRRGWDTTRAERIERMRHLGLLAPDTEPAPRYGAVPAWHSLSPAAQEERAMEMALYAAVMELLDDNIGRMLNTLAEQGDLHNTVVVFLSDNGGSYEDPVPSQAPWAIHPTDGVPGSAASFPSYKTAWANVSNTPFAYFKSHLHEGGIATPLLLRLPAGRGTPHVNTHTVGHIMDLHPTLLDLCQVSMPDSLQGRAVLQPTGTSLLPVLQRPTTAQVHDTLYWEHQGNRAVRTTGWKAVSVRSLPDSSGLPGTWELYHMVNDPTEQHNLAAAYPDTLQALTRSYGRWAQRVGVADPK